MPPTNENKPPSGKMSDEALAAIKAIRALVASLKETSTVLSVMRDYRAIEGEPLPYRKFGFSNVEDFLRASGEFVVKHTEGDSTRIYVKPNRDSAHIQEMVSAQKPSGKSSKRPNFVALRQPTTPSLSGRGFGGSATQYSRNFQQMPYGGRVLPNSGSPKKVSFRPSATTNGTTAAAASASSKGKASAPNGQPAAKMPASMRPITRTIVNNLAVGGTATTTVANGKGSTSRNTNSSTTAEMNNNNRTTKNLNAGAQQQQPLQQQLPTNDLRHWLNERNGNLSRSSVEIRQSALALGGGTAPSGGRVGSTIVRKLPFSVEDKTVTKQQPPLQQQVLQASSSNARKPSQSNGTPSVAQQPQQRNNIQLNSTNRSNGGGGPLPKVADSGMFKSSVVRNAASVKPPAAALLPLMSIDVPPPSTSGGPTKSVNSRLQLAKTVLPSAGAAAQPPIPPATQPITYQRAQSLDGRSSQYSTQPAYHVPTARLSQPNSRDKMTYTIGNAVAPPPSLPTLPGRKSLQDRLTLNQQVAEQDLQKVADKLAESSNVPLFERTVSAPAASAVTTLPTSPFGPTTRPTTFSWSDPNATPVELLVTYSSYKGYVRPEYRYYRLKSGRIQCRVTINGSTYSTYPADFGNEFEGQFAAALAAIEAIQRDESRQSTTVCLDSDPDIAGYIYELLAGCPHGMFSKNIPDAFRSAHQTLLPDHWFAIIDRYANQLFLLEEGPGDTIVFARDQPSSSDAGSNTSEARLMSMNQLALPWNEPYWNLYVTNPVSTLEVWARLVGKEYSDKMDALITDIEISMLSSQPKADESGAAVGEYYLVSITDCWYRVRVDEINYEANHCQCFFIDIGEREQIALDQLYQCDPKYLALPGQARCFTLDGLEDFSENPKAKHHLDALISGRVFIAEVLTKREEHEAAEQRDGPGAGPLKLMLYDTSSEFDVLLNPIILKHICDDTPLPELNRKTVNYVNISHVNDHGDVYCQKDGTMKYIQKLITNLTQSNALEGKHRGLYKSKAADQQQLYLVQDETDDKWYRAALDAEESGPYCRMLYVDVGCRRQANVSNIYRLERLSLALSSYPPQAIRMRMFELPGCGEPLVLARIRAFLKPAMPAMAKVLAMASSSLPLVKLFVHVSEAGSKILVCVNEAIKIEQELEMGSELISVPRIDRSGNNDTINSSDSDTATTVTSSHSAAGGYSLSSADGNDLAARFDGLNLCKTSSTLPATPASSSSSGNKAGAIAKLAKMTLPPVGRLFDVKVTIASSPKFFIIQPYANAKQLNQLMRELQEFCMSKAALPVRRENVRQGEAYAAINRDGHWYRIMVVNIILFGEKPIHAYFCDFGLVEMLDMSNLRVLPAKFRVLPQQAVKAKLYGVKPLNKDWQTADAVRFQELSVERKFASIVRNVQADEFNPNEELVELELIDVSTSDDIYIHKVLVDEGRAVYTAEAHTV